MLAAEAVRQNEERQTFLLTLSDALLAEPGADAMAALAVQLLADELRVERCYIVTYRGEGDLWDVGPEFRRPGVPALPPVLDQSQFPEALRIITDRTLVFDNIAELATLSEPERAGLRALGFGGLVMAVLRAGAQRPSWSMVVSSPEPRHWSRAEITLLEETAERTWAAIERARAEAALKASEARFQQFADASSGALWIRDAGTLEMEYVSSAIRTIYGIEPDALLGDIRQWAALIVPDDRDRALQHIDQAQAGTPAVHEFRIQRPSDGSFRWIRDTDFPLFDDKGCVQRIGGIAEDVSETKRLTEHQKVLLAELQHRVRNIMGVIRSITNRSASGATSVADYRSILEGRLMAISRVQALLTRGANAGGSLREVIRSEISAQAHAEDQFELTGPDVMLSPKAVEVLTLAFHELTTNALKYGGLSGQDGTVSVRWEPLDRRGENWLGIDWVETGAPARAPSERRGFGSELIEARIPYELGGTGKVSIEPGGARCRIEFPLHNAESILETDAPAPTTVFGGSIDMTGAPDLTGQSVLIVEDDYYMAADSAAALRGAGATVLGPCPREEDTRRLLEHATPTAAVVDLNLGGGGPKFEIARLLRERGVPFVFLTGYDPEVIPDELADVVRLQQPIPLRELVDAIARLGEA